MAGIAATSRLNPQVHLPPAVVDLSMVLLLLFLRIYASWLSWVDPLVDFGRELYIPWRITDGAVLYRDIASFYGPFSAYFNAGVFALGGVSIATVAAANAVVCGVLVSLIYLTAREIASRLAAVLAAVTFVMIFSCGPVLGLALFNYMAPYSHDLTYGLTLAAGAMLCLVRFVKRPARGALIGCGFLLGMTFLTKPEVFVAAAGAAVVGLGLVATGRAGKRPKDFSRWMLLFAGAAVVPGVLSVALLAMAMPVTVAARGVVGSWPFLFDSRVTELPFFKWLRGTDNLPRSLAMIGKSATFWSGSVALVFGLAMAGRVVKTRTAAVAAGIAASVILATVLVSLTLAGVLRVTLAAQEIVIAQALPLLLLGFCGWCGWRIMRQRGSAALLAAQFAAAVFALAMLAKIFFYTRFDHYGFALAMPATMAMVVFLVDIVPAIAGRSTPASAMIARGGALGVLAFVVWITCPISGLREIPLSFGADSFVFVPNGAAQADRGPMLQKAVRWIRANAGPHETLAVLPEGVMLNYLSRRANSTPYVNVLPPEYLMWGRERILHEFSVHPPTYIALVQRPTPEYGVPVFGKDYAPELLAWVREHYERQELIGEIPLVQPKQPFGIEILKRRDVR